MALLQLIITNSLASEILRASESATKRLGVVCQVGNPEEVAKAATAVEACAAMWRTVCEYGCLSIAGGEKTDGDGNGTAEVPAAAGDPRE